MTLSWSEVQSPDGIQGYYYELFDLRRIGGGVMNGTVDQAGVSLYIDCHGTYTWHVRAINSKGEYGEWSEEVEINIGD